MKVIIIDNYDSFTWNLFHYAAPFCSEITVVRNDEISIDEIEKYDKIILSPGPGLPKDAGITMNIIKQYHAIKPILGICLGHQAIGEFFGLNLFNLPEVKHGIQRKCEINTEDYLFNNLPNTIDVGHYHSWNIEWKNTGMLESIAQNNEGFNMALRHKTFDIRGIQFHPESIYTPEGKQIIKNWIEH